MTVWEGNVWAQCVYKAVVYALGRRQGGSEAGESTPKNKKPENTKALQKILRSPPPTAILLFDALVTTRL